MDEENRFLRDFSDRIARLQRILESQGPGEQGAVQAQFDRMLVQLDSLHGVAVSRGFLTVKRK